VYILTKILIIFLATIIILSSIMVDFWGLFGSALTIVAGIEGIGIMIWYELRKQGSKFTETKEALDKMNNFLRNVTRSQINEKIAILNNHLTEIPWESDKIVKHKTNKIINEIRAIQEVAKLLTTQQKEELSKARDNTIEAMSAESYDISGIKAAFNIISLT
jgi:hypothetical protein